jgi:CRP/FNR family transcriptional regulator, cyclic AMP receptor protein
MDAKSFYLKTFQLANHLTEQQLAELCQGFIQKEAKKGQAVYMKGSDRRIFLLVSGKVKVSEISILGNETIKELIGPGELFGDVMLQSEATSTEHAEIISERATYYVISQDNLTTLLKSIPMLMLDYMAKVSERFKSLENRYVFMMTRDVKSRLIYCFKEWARKEGKTLDGKVIVKNSLTHHDLANLISTSRQTVTVILNELKEEGVLNYNRKEFELSPLMLAS